MIVDLHIISTWVVTVGSIMGGVYGVYKTTFRPVLERLKEHSEALSALSAWTTTQQEDIDNGAHERRILIEGVLACLKGLEEQGCNGPVSKSIAEIEGYLIKSLHRTRSNTNLI